MFASQYRRACYAPVCSPTVLHTIRHTEAFPTNDSLGANTNDALVRANVDPSNTSSIVGHADGRNTSTCVPVGAPRGFVDSILAAITGALVGCWSTSRLGRSAFGAFEVVSGGRQFLGLWQFEGLLFVEHNASCSAVCEPRLQLSNTGWNRTGSASATSGS